MFSPATRPIRCMLVEDRQSDVDMARYAVQVAQAEMEFQVVADGAEALATLHHPGPTGHPDLVMLDLDLPGLGGLDVLRAIRDDDDLTHVPVIVLTGSVNPADIRQAYALHANACVRKPVDFDAFVETMRTVVLFWRGTAQLPVPIG